MNPVRAVAERFVDNAEFSSVEWAIQKKGNTVESGVVGAADHAAQTPVPENAIYRIYSMTKPIVSVAALMLIQDQKLRLFDPVAKFLPAMAAQKILHTDGSQSDNPAFITIEHLLTHRSGLSYDFLPDCPVAALYREHGLAANSTSTLAEFVDKLTALPLAYIPGANWKYSYATDVLARIIELVAEQPIDEFLKTKILSPLDMHDTDFGVASAEQHRVMPMYGARSLAEIMAPPPPRQILQKTEPEASYPAEPNLHFRRGGHGLFSTTRDYLQFCQFMHNGNTADGEVLLTNSVFDLMWANRLPQAQLPLKIGPNPYPGYGWNLAGRVMLDIGQSMIITTAGEGGWGGAASTYFWVDRARETSGVVMTQYLGSSLSLGGDMHSAANILLDQHEAHA